MTTPIVVSKPMEWNGRTWMPVTDAMPPGEMRAYLRAEYFRYDSESAAEMSTGGTYDVHGTFYTTTYTVAYAGVGLVQLYRATDLREITAP